LENYLQDIEKAKEILGDDILECLKNVFIHLDDEPPCVLANRYRADNPNHMTLLDTLQHEHHLIYVARIKNDNFYLLKPYALPLIETNKSKALLKAMFEIYSYLPDLYKKRLDESVLAKEIINISKIDKTIGLEALFYLSKCDDVWTGLGEGFPYQSKSFLNIAEKTLVNDFGQTLTNHFRLKILNNGKNNLTNDIIIDTGITDQKTGRPTFKNQIIYAYEQLKKENIINFDMKFVSHVGVIQNKIIELNPTINDIKGLDYKTLSKHLGAKFKADKKSQN